jgi:hypothetical protein
MPLDTNSLKSNIKNRVKAVDVVEGDAPAEIAAIIGEEVAAFVQPLVDAFNQHTHAGVITAVTGGSGAPAVGIPGSTQTTTSTV